MYFKKRYVYLYYKGMSVCLFVCMYVCLSVQQCISLCFDVYGAEIATGLWATF